MKTIPLTKGYTAQVSDEDFETLDKTSWCYSHGYAIRRQSLGYKKSKNVYMHRQIMGVEGKHIQVDHINGDRLDNRRENLRVCNQTQNNHNTHKPKSKSGYKGVVWVEDHKKWRAYITLNKKVKVLGYFKTAKEAAKAYDKAALENFGEFARPNFEVNDAN